MPISARDTRLSAAGYTVRGKSPGLGGERGERGHWWEFRSWSLEQFAVALFSGALALVCAACGVIGFLVGWLLRRSG